VSQIREIAGGGSYLSQSDLRAHFGLGRQPRIESIEISWPSGLRHTFKDIGADQFYVVEEGKDALRVQSPKR
jgi:enediyne biosynthesis protein E4